jgi:hypothetical protein
MKVIKNLGE